MMKVVSTAQLKTQANWLLRQITMRRQPIIITRHGHPCAVLEPFTEDDIEDLVFEYGQDVAKMAKQSAADMKAGRYTTMQAFAKKHGLA